MCKKYFSMAVLAAVLLAVGFAANIRADVILFNDNFNTTVVPGSTNDYCLNTDLAVRQAGGLNSYQWARDVGTTNASTIQVNNATAGLNALNYSPAGTTGNTTVIIQHNFNDLTNSFTIQWDSLPESVGYKGTDHARSTWVGIGSDASNKGGLYDPSCDFSLSIGNDGGCQLWHNGYLTPSKKFYFDLNPMLTIPSTRWYTAKITVTLSAGGFTPGASYTVDAWAGLLGNPNVQLDLNDPPTGPAVDGMSYTGTWGTNGNNYISVTANGTSLVDNFMITSPIPEPSALALLCAGLIGLLAYAWRKRR